MQKLHKSNIAPSEDLPATEALPKVETRLKIFQRDNKRLAIKLEDEFWHQLEQCGREEGRKLSDLIFEETANADAALNRTAYLRLYCLRWLRQRLQRSRQSGGNLNLQTVLSACPSPCVIMTREKAIIAYNTAFANNILARLASSKNEDAKAGPLTFKLNTSLEEIHEALLAGTARYRDTKAAFVKQGKVIKTDARFCLLEAEKGRNTPLLCFLVTN